MNLSAKVTGGNISLSLDMAAVFEEAGEVVAGEAREMCPEDAGELKNSIAAKEVEDGVEIYADTDYAADVEFGTSKTAAQPFLIPALLNSKNKITACAAKAIGEMI